MTLEEAMAYFKSGYELCKKLNISYSNLVRWKKQNYIPLKQQHRINEITGVNMPLDIDKEAMERRINVKS